VGRRALLGDKGQGILAGIVSGLPSGLRRPGLRQSGGRPGPVVSTGLVPLQPTALLPGVLGPQVAPDGVTGGERQRLRWAGDRPPSDKPDLGEIGILFQEEIGNRPPVKVGERNAVALTLASYPSRRRQSRLSIRNPARRPHGATLDWAGFATPAYRGEKNTPLNRAFPRAIRGAGGQPSFVLKTGTADLSVVALAWACPAVAYGPGGSSLDHTAQEHISVPEYARHVSLLNLEAI